MAVANYMLEFTDLSDVWFVISPQNPFKEKSSLLADNHRYALATIAIKDEPGFKVSDIEFKLPQPSFTIDTLTYLHEKYPRHDFKLIVGSDQLPSFHKWKNFEQILEYYELYVYPRPNGDSGEYNNHPKVKRVAAPLMDISSSFIRESIHQKKNIRYFLPEGVFDYICEMHFYEK